MNPLASPVTLADLYLAAAIVVPAAVWVSARIWRSLESPHIGVRKDG